MPLDGLRLVLHEIARQQLKRSLRIQRFVSCGPRPSLEKEDRFRLASRLSPAGEDFVYIHLDAILAGKTQVRRGVLEFREEARAVGKKAEMPGFPPHRKPCVAVAQVHDIIGHHVESAPRAGESQSGFSRLAGPAEDQPSIAPRYRRGVRVSVRAGPAVRQHGQDQAIEKRVS